MKRIQPYHILIGLAALFVIAGVIMYGAHGLTSLKHGEPIEPHNSGEKENLFELWFSGAGLLDLSVDRNVTGIIFGTDSKKVSLLDRDRRLRWEKSFPAKPLQTKISACGSYLAVGTEGGDLFFMSTDQERWWQQELGEPIYLVALSANGKWVLIARGAPEQEEHCLELYDGHDGALQWSIPTGPLQRIHLAGEQLSQGMAFYSCRPEGVLVTGAISLTGDHLWENRGVDLAAVSRTESRLALTGDSTIAVSRNQGEILWQRSLPAGFTPTAVMFNPQNNNLLVYSSDEGLSENLYYFDSEGKILWQKQIAGGALLSFTADGSRIITSSWRHYNEDFSQMVLLDETGEAYPTSLELAMRVERMLVSTSRRYIVISGEDGYIDVIDLYGELARDKSQPSTAAPFYSPVITELDKDQMAVTLYFAGEDNLIPVSRLISQTDSPLRAAIEELIRGPSRESDLSRLISKEAGIEVSLDLERGQLFLELSPELAQLSGSCQTMNVLNSLLYTANGFPEIKEIYLTVDKVPLEVFGDGLVLEQPLEPRRLKDPVFVPVRIKEHYYIIPREARELEIERRDLEGLLRAVVKQCRTFYFVPGDLTLIDALEDGDRARINLNSSFRMLFPENGSTEEQLQAAMVLDALFLTALENSNCHRFEIFVEGENWSPPQEYPPLNRDISKPYYINPDF